ncbi:mask, partial [Symbiodinium sp. CCMP2456]
MVEMPRIWVMVPPRAPSFCPETNPGLAPATSKLFYANFLKSRNIYEESHNARSMLRNDPVELFAKRTAPRKPFVEVNTGLNTSLKRPKSAQMSALSRARSASSLDQGTKDDTWPVPVDPETGRPARPDPRQRQFYKTRSTLTMGVIDDVYSNPERKACPEMYMAQRYGVHAAHPVGFPGRYTPSACRVDSTGDLS